MRFAKKSSIFAALLAVLFVGSFASLTFPVFAEEAPATAPAPMAPGAPVAAAPVAQPQQPGFLGMAVPFILVFGIMYFLMIRPQQKRMKEQQDMLAALKQGDEVVTTSGFLGTVREIAEKVVTLELAANVRVRVLKSQIAQVVKGQVKDLTA